MGLAALLSSAALSAYAQPAAPAPMVVPPAPIASDAAIMTPPAPRPPVGPGAQPDTDNKLIIPVNPPRENNPEPTAPEVNVPPAPSVVPAPPAGLPSDVNVPPTPPLPGSAGVPSLPGEAASTETPDAQMDIVTDAPVGFDNFGTSVFYKPNDIGKLKAALDIADALARKAALGVSKIEEAIIPMPEPPKIEISEYPVFHLSSIMYQGPGKWVIWLNGNRTTSKNLPPDLSVIAINTQQVRFEWKPKIISALENRWKTEEGDASKTTLKKLLSGANMVSSDSKTGAVRFVLRPNQTYSSAYNSVLEGKHAPIAVAGDSGVIDVGAFEQTLRENEARNQAASPPNYTNPATRMPRIIRPGNQAATPMQPGAPILGSGNSEAQQPPQQAQRRSGLVTPDTASIGLVPSIFPGGVPAAAQPQQTTPPVAPDPGLPILPPGAQ